MEVSRDSSSANIEMTDYSSVSSRDSKFSFSDISGEGSVVSRSSSGRISSKLNQEESSLASRIVDAIKDVFESLSKLDFHGSYVLFSTKVLDNLDKEIATEKKNAPSNSYLPTAKEVKKFVVKFLLLRPLAILATIGDVVSRTVKNLGKIDSALEIGKYEFELAKLNITKNPQFSHTEKCAHIGLAGLKSVGTFFLRAASALKDVAFDALYSGARGVSFLLAGNIDPMKAGKSEKARTPLTTGQKVINAVQMFFKAIVMSPAMLLANLSKTKVEFLKDVSEIDKKFSGSSAKDAALKTLAFAALFFKGVFMATARTLKVGLAPLTLAARTFVTSKEMNKKLDEYMDNQQDYKGRIIAGQLFEGAKATLTTDKEVEQAKLNLAKGQLLHKISDSEALPDTYASGIFNKQKFIDIKEASTELSILRGIDESTKKSALKKVKEAEVALAKNDISQIDYNKIDLSKDDARENLLVLQKAYQTLSDSKISGPAINRSRQNEYTVPLAEVNAKLRQLEG